MKNFALVTICGALLLTSANIHAQEGGGPRRGGMRGGPGGMMGAPRVMGVVQSVSDKQITVKDEEDTIWTIDAGDNTRVLKEREPAKWADLTKGQAVVAMGMAEPGKKEIHAMFISMLSSETAQRMAEYAAKMKADLGKTYLTGRITKIDETKLTIKRPDGVEQVAMVDENTSLRKGGGMMPGTAGPRGNGAPMGAGATPATAAAPPTGEPITLVDLKVGDNVMGPGELKSGTFTFKELHQVVRREGGPRRPGGEPAPTAQ